MRLFDDDDPEKEPVIAIGVVETTQAFNHSTRYDEDDEEMVGQSSLENLHPPSLEVGEEEQTVVCRDVDLTPILISKNGRSCVRLRAQISSNNHDYSEPSPEKIICHWFTPTMIFPSCSPFAGQREICCTGTGLLPTSQVPVEVVHTLRLPPKSEGGEESVYEVAVPVRSECWEELSYTVPSLSDFFLHENRAIPAVDVINVEISFRITTGELLSTAPFHFSYYSFKPVEVSPKWIRRSGGSVLTVTGPGVLFYSEAARIVMVDTTRLNGNSIVKYDEFTKIIGNDGEETDQWKITFTTPSLLEDPLSPRDQEPEDHPIAFVGLLLDGISQPPDSELTRVSIFTEVVLTQASLPSKGPVAVGSLVPVVASGLQNTGICQVRIQSHDGRYIETTGTIDADCRGFSFILPPSVTSLFPEGVGSKHVESFYLEVSIDGSTYDRTEGPYLQVKA